MHFIILNILRLLSISFLLLALAGSVCAIVGNWTTTSYFVFVFFNNVFIIIGISVLTASELEMPKSYLDDNIPFLGTQSTLVPLAIFQIAIASSLLTSLSLAGFQDSPLKEVVMAGGISLLVVGCLNGIASKWYEDIREVRRFSFSNSEDEEKSLPSGVYISNPIPRL